MECKTTSAANRRRAAFSFVELLVAGAISALAVGTVVSFSLYSGRALLAASNRMDLEAQARNALDVLTRELRSSVSLKECGTNRIVMYDFDKQLLTFEFDAKKRQLRWDKRGRDEVLLKDCDMVTFDLFGRVPASGTYDLVPVTSPDQVKAVRLTMNCSRTFVLPKIQALNTTTATIILRMK